MADRIHGLAPGERVLAHRIIYKGKEYPMSVAGIDEQGKVEIVPYRLETPNTYFVQGTIEITAHGTPRSLTYREIVGDPE